MRDPVQGSRQVTGQARVPGVRVHHIGRGDRGGHRQVGRDSLQRGVGVAEPIPRAVRDRVWPVGPLAVHGQVDQVAQFPGQVLHVHAGAAIDLGRVLPGQQGDVDLAEGRGHGVTSWPLPTTVMPPAETTKPRARSWSLSTPTTALSGTTTFLSRMAFSTTACLPMVVLCMMTDRSTLDQELIRTPGDRTELRTKPPETTTPLLTTLLIARPMRSPVSCTNLAGGCDGTWVRIGHWSLYRLKIGWRAHRSRWASKYESSVPTSRQ